MKPLPFKRLELEQAITEAARTGDLTIVGEMRRAMLNGKRPKWARDGRDAIGRLMHERQVAERDVVAQGRSIASVRQSESRKRAAPWEGRGNRD